MGKNNLLFFFQKSQRNTHFKKILLDYFPFSSLFMLEYHAPSHMLTLGVGIRVNSTRSTSAEDGGEGGLTRKLGIGYYYLE